MSLYRDPEVVEHAMRLCCDEGLVAMVGTCPVGSAHAAGLVGRITARGGAVLVEGTPLVTLVRGGQLDPQWRGLCPQVDGSLFSQLQQLRALTELPGPFADVYDEWQQRSEQFDSVFT